MSLLIHSHEDCKAPPWDDEGEDPPKLRQSHTAVASFLHCPMLRVIQVCYCHWLPMVKWRFIDITLFNVISVPLELQNQTPPMRRAGWARMSYAFEFAQLAVRKLPRLHYSSQKQHCYATTHFDSLTRRLQSPSLRWWRRGPTQASPITHCSCFLFALPNAEGDPSMLLPLTSYGQMAVHRHHALQRDFCAIGTSKSNTHLHLWPTHQLNTVLWRDGRPTGRTVATLMIHFHIGRRRYLWARQRSFQRRRSRLLQWGFQWRRRQNVERPIQNGQGNDRKAGERHIHMHASHSSNKGTENRQENHPR